MKTEILVCIAIILNDHSNPFLLTDITAVISDCVAHTYTYIHFISGNSVYSITSGAKGL